VTTRLHLEIHFTPAQLLTLGGAVEINTAARYFVLGIPD